MADINATLDAMQRTLVAFTDLPVTSEANIRLDIWGRPLDEQTAILDWLCDGGHWRTHDVAKDCRHYLLSKGCFELNIGALHLPDEEKGGAEGLGSDLGHRMIVTEWNKPSETLTRKNLSAFIYALTQLAIMEDPFLTYARTMTSNGIPWPEHGANWPPGTVIEYAQERYRIRQNFGDRGTVEYLDGEFANNNFYWTFDGEKCRLIELPA